MALGKQEGFEMGKMMVMQDLAWAAAIIVVALLGGRPWRRFCWRRWEPLPSGACA